MEFSPLISFPFHTWPVSKQLQMEQRYNISKLMQRTGLYCTDCLTLETDGWRRIKDNEKEARFAEHVNWIIFKSTWEQDPFNLSGHLIV